MTDLAKRIAALSPEKRQLLERLVRERRSSSDAPPRLARVPGKAYPLSYAQQRFWFLHELDPGKNAYQIPLVLELTGDLRVDVLHTALNDMTRRHEVLRTTFIIVDGEPRQRIHEPSHVELDVKELAAALEANERREAERLTRDWLSRPFDLERGPLARFKLLRLSERVHWLWCVFHHVIADGWSLDVFQRELGELYAARLTGNAVDTERVSLQYVDYASWQRSQLDGDRLNEDLDYWHHKLEGAPSLITLPSDKPRPPTQSYRGGFYHAVLRRELNDDLRQLANEHNATRFMVLLAALNVLLHRYTGSTDLSVGSPIAIRPWPELEKALGVFINSLVLRSDVSGNPRFTELLRRVREVTLDAFSHQNVPFEKLLEELSPERDAGQSPLFQIMLVVQDLSPSLPWGDVGVERVVLNNGTSIYDLVVYAYHHDGGLGLSVQYCSDLFEEVAIERFVAQLERLLESVVADPNERIGSLRVAPDAEEATLRTWNDTAADYPRETTLARLFEERVEESPERLAVKDERGGLSFAELNRRANVLAHRLAAVGVGPGAIVGILTERSVDMVVALFGVLKTGAAYLPLDPAYPETRLAFMLADARVNVLVTEPHLKNRLLGFDGTLVLVASERTEAKDTNLEAAVDASALAYVLYTSGSTGRPKGVMGTHRATVNRLAWMWRELPFAAGEVCSQKTTLSFVDSVWEIFGPLLQGVPLVILADDAVKDPERLVQSLAEERVSRIVLVPSLLRSLIDHVEALGARLPHLRLWTASGETLPVELCRRFHRAAPAATLLNLYGSSEVAADATFFDTRELEPEAETVPIGRPIDNIRIHILDDSRTPVPIGAPGELFVAGDGVAKGYFGKSQLTRERFVEHPLEPTSRLARTGDLARWRHDGTLEYLGRADHQVKIRGVRVELGEVESALSELSSVRQAVVLMDELQQDHQRLVAFVTTNNGSGIDVVDLRRQLKKTLPDYMVPSAFMALDALPLLPNGKVDRNALSKLETRPVTGEERRAAHGGLELQLSAIWSELLEVDDVGLHDNFFELGGHSLMAVRMFARVHELTGVRVPLATLFRAATVAELASAIRAADFDGAWSCLVPIQSRGSRPALFCIHAAGGEVLFYRELARHLGPDQPVYGLQARGLDGSVEPHESIEAIATDYIAEIKRVQPEGPYYLGGHCYGGVILFEMAQQLLRRNESVGLAVMMDGSQARINTGVRHRMQYALRALANHPIALLSHIAKVEIAGRLRWHGRALRESVHRNDTYDPGGEAQARVGEAMERAYLRYTPQVYPGRIVYFMNSDRARLGHIKWRELARDGLDLHVFPGTPNTTFVSPSVEVLAEGVRSCLRAARGEGPDDARVPGGGPDGND